MENSPSLSQDASTLLFTYTSIPKVNDTTKPATLPLRHLQNTASSVTTHQPAFSPAVLSNNNPPKELIIIQTRPNTVLGLLH